MPSAKAGLLPMLNSPAVGSERDSILLTPWRRSSNTAVPQARRARPCSVGSTPCREREDGRHPDDLNPDFRLKANRSNDYFIDRKQQKNENFTGIEGINTQDVAIQECMGPIVDRSAEHLGSTDRAIIAMRRMLLEAIATVETGGTPKGVDTRSYSNVRAVDKVVEDVSLVKETIARESVARF
jgi:phthalate 4,5-dioxygenase oxygenase subunit